MPEKKFLHSASERFRSRSSERDRKSDTIRFAEIRTASRRAYEEAAREKDGLQRRLDTYQFQAAALLDRGDYESRSPQDEDTIRRAEEEIVRGLERIKSLEEQLTTLQRILELIGVSP